ncbi:hypothetical protein [Mycobacterium sp.]|uniref:hypothetical protein n=1 Tax=Mycobacterium paragordonae TaxID=1389713 RepID=UPI001DFFB146|nr:hypothetical protein [Mycobacterium sp.]
MNTIKGQAITPGTTEGLNAVSPMPRSANYRTFGGQSEQILPLGICFAHLLSAASRLDRSSHQPNGAMTRTTQIFSPP